MVALLEARFIRARSRLRCGGRFGATEILRVRIDALADLGLPRG